MDLKTCVICGVAADTVRDGRDFCGIHNLSDMPFEPTVVCSREGCGCAATTTVAGRPYCYHCAPWHRQAAGELERAA